MEGPPQHPSDLDVSIAFRKGKWFCTDHLISHFILCDCFNSSFHQFALPLSSISILRCYEEAKLVPTWKQVMDEEMHWFLEDLGTWSLLLKVQ